MPALQTPSPLGTDQSDPTSFSINPAAVSSQDVLQREAAQRDQELQTQTSLQRQATPAEQQASPATPLNEETTNAANKVVSSYNNFILQGGDLSKLSKDELDSVINGAASLPEIEHPETDPARMLAKYRKGQLTPTTANLGLVGDFFKGATGTIGNLISQGGAAIAHIVPGIDQTDDWLKFWVQNASATTMAARSIPDQYLSLVSGSRDIFNSTRLAMEQGGTTDPDRKAQIDAAQTEIIRQRMVSGAGAEAAMVDARDKVANVYKAVGANHFADTVMSVKPDDPRVQFGQTVIDPLNYLAAGGEALVGKGLSGTMKAGVRFQRVADATEAINASLDRQAAAALGRTQIESALSSSAPMTAATRAGMESNLARLKTVQGNLSSVHDAVTTEYQTALANANEQMTSMAKSDPFAGAAGKLANMGATGATAVGKITDIMEAMPDLIAKTMMPGDEAAQKAFAAGIRKTGNMATAAMGQTIGAALGHAAGGFIGGAAGYSMGKGAMDLLGKTISSVKPLARELALIGDQLALGQQTLPFLRAYAEKTSGLPAAIASKLDKSVFAPVLYATPNMAGGAAIGAGLGAVQGYISSGGDPRAAAQGAGGGFVFGMAGSGLGQMGKFNSPAALRQASIGDRARFLKNLSPGDTKLFQGLHPEHQLAVSVYGMAHPDLDVHFTNDPKGPNGSWHASIPRASVNINVAGDNPLHAILAHEIGHHVANNGLSFDITNYILGDKITGKAGITTALDDAGRPMIDPTTGDFIQNAEFQRYKGDYNARKLRDVPGSHPEDDAGIAQEMFADLHATYLSNPEQLQKAIRGHIPSDIVSENTAKHWLSKIGMATDGVTGNPFPTGDISKTKDIQSVINSYYKQKTNKARPIETDHAASKVPVGDILKGTSEFDRMSTHLDSTGDIARNPDGSIKTDMAGRPVLVPKKEADAAHAALAQHVLDVYKNQPGLADPNNPNGLQLVTDRNGRQVYRGQTIPDAVFDQITASNQHNNNQIINWRNLTGIMTRDDGSMVRGVYNTATKGKGKYATLAARERAMVPLYTEISPETKQVNIQMYDPEQIQTHITKMLKGKKGKELYDGQLAPALDDVRDYMNNLANNRPGETGIGLEKKGVINEMFGINADANPYVADLAKRPSNQSVFKTFRLDRINRVAELTGQRQPVTSQTYEQVRSYMQPQKASATAPPETPPMVAGQDLGNDGHSEAIRATIGNPNAKDPIAKIDYGLTEAPLLGQSAVGATSKANPTSQPIGQERMDSQFKYLNPTEQKRLQTLAGNGATTKLGDRIVKEFQKWKDNPDIQAGMGWYSRMREKLKQVFGDDHDQFTQLLGATSARTPVDTNFLQSADAFEQHKAGKFDRHIEEYHASKQMREDGSMLDHALENNYQLPVTDKKTGEVTGWRDPKSQAEAQAAYLIAKDAIPRQSNGQKFNANSMQVLKVLAGTWLDESQAPKTPNFAGNLSGRTLQATIDVWAARMLRRVGYEGKTGKEPWRILPKSEAGVSNLDFAFSQLAMEHAAKKLGMNPDDLQAVAWFAEKHHWDKKGWTDTIGARKASFDEIFHLMYGGEKPLSVGEARSKIAELKAQKGYE